MLADGFIAYWWLLHVPSVHDLQETRTQLENLLCRSFILLFWNFCHSSSLLLVKTNNHPVTGLYGDFTSSSCILPTNRRNYKIFVSQGPCWCASLKFQMPLCLKKEKGLMDTCNPRSSNTGDFLGRCWIDKFACFLSLLHIPGRLALQILLTFNWHISDLIQDQKERCKKI